MTTIGDISQVINALYQQDARRAQKAVYDEQLKGVQAENADLLRQLSEKSELLDKAVKDIKTIADWYRECRCDDGICGLCKYDADHGLDGDANECAGFYKNDCFEWRGPQEAPNE